jgi:hypothetical protein
MKLRRSLYARPENRPRRAMRRGAAWPAKRPSSRLVVREHKHGWASQRAVARRGGQGGPDAGCAVVTVSASERPGVQCPVSGVRHPCVRRPRCPTAMRLRGVAVGPAAVRLGMAGVGVVARHVHDGASSAPGWSLALEAGAGRAGPRRVDLDWSSSWEVVSTGPGRPGGRRERLGCARGSPIGRQLAVTTLRGHCARAGPGSGGL